MMARSGYTLVNWDMKTIPSTGTGTDEIYLGPVMLDGQTLRKCRLLGLVITFCGDMYMESEEIIVNLNVLRQLKKGQRLCTRGEYLDIETPHLIPECIRRWRRQETRNEMITTLNRIINNALILQQTDNNLIPYIRQSIVGIENIKHTYSICHQTSARLDMILDKIKKAIPIDEE